MNLLQYYESLLMTAGMKVSEDGNVSIHLNDHSEPMTIKGKRLVIPTKQQLTTPDWDNRVVFHPLSEDLTKGETEVFARFRNAINRRVNMTLAYMAMELLHLAASPDLHKSMTPKQTKYLVELKDVDEKTVENFARIIKKLPAGDARKNFCSFYMRRNSKVMSTAFAKVCVVSFPLYEEIMESTDNTIYGVKVRIKDIAAYKSLLNYIIPNIGDPEQYYYAGSNSMIAPYTVALMTAVHNVIKEINTVQERHAKKGTKGLSDDDFVFRTDWFTLTEDLTPLVPQIRLIPSQESPSDVSVNQSVLNKPTQEFELPEAQVQQVKPQVQTQAPQQQPVPPPVQQKPKVSSVDDILNYSPQAQQLYGQPQYQQQYVQPPPVGYYQPQPIPNPYIQAQPAMTASGWPVQQPQQYYAPPGQPVYQQHPIGPYGYPIKG